MKIEADRDCGESEPASSLDPASDLQPTSADQLLSPHCSEPETKDSDDDSVETEDSDDDWKETNEPQSGLNTLKNNEVLGGHMGPHTGVKPFSCPVCAKGFNQKGNIHVHMRSHTGERPFSCSVCGKRFLQKGTLTRHMTVHTREKPFSCSVCNKSWSRKQNLVTHMSIHTGEKSFSCSVCNKSFRRKNTLVAHMRVHTGEKPFSCSIDYILDDSKPAEELIIKDGHTCLTRDNFRTLGQQREMDSMVGNGCFRVLKEAIEHQRRCTTSCARKLDGEQWFGFTGTRHTEDFAGKV
ncbi:uncharacterized protein ACN63O_006274 [Diretmus argenteus]